MEASKVRAWLDPGAPAFVSRQVESAHLFWFEPAKEEDRDVRVVGAGFEVCRADYRIDRSNFPWLCFEFVASGRGSLVLAGRRAELRPGSFFFYGPGVGHHIACDAGDPLKKYFLTVTGAEVEQLVDRIGLLPGTISESTNAAAMSRAFDELLTRGSKRSELGQELCVALAKQILLMARADSLDAGLADTRAFRTYRRVRDFIESRHLEVTSLDEVAAGCELDPAYLCRLFSRFQEETPYQHLTRLRMEHAARRLTGGALSVKAVSEELGFSDPFHFSRVFKGVHRVPPSRFRDWMGRV